MKQLTLLKFTACVALFFITGCNPSSGDKTTDTKLDTSQVMTTKPDLTQIKNEIQERETAWAKADNAKDSDAVADFYADDAISLEADQPMLHGKEAIKNNIKIYLAKRAKGSTTTYDVMDVYGDGNYATEVGKTTRKDSTGKVIFTGKYMAVWQNRNGKWICIRDIANNDVKEK